MFHEPFVNLLNAGAGAYLSTEAANVEQALTNAANAPAGAPLRQSASATSAVTGAAGGTIVGPYESLIANTAANLQSIGNTWVNVTAPTLLQTITTQTNPS